VAQLDSLLHSGSQHRGLLNAAAQALTAEVPPTGSAEGRTALLALVREQLPIEAQKLPEELAESSRGALAALEELPRAKPEQRAELQTRRNRFVSAMPVLMGEFADNIKARKLLKQDVSAEQTRLRELLLDTSKWMSIALRRTAGEIDRLRLDAYGKPKADEQGVYDDLLEFRSLLAEAQRKNITLMDQYGIETVALRQELISTTGQMSKDIFDAQVMKGLVGGWKADTTRWLSEHAAALAFRVGSVVLVLLLFTVLARMGRSLVRRALVRAKANPSSLASGFLIQTSGRVIWVVGLVIAAAQLGIEVGPLLAGLGIAGFVAGFAFQDTHSNFPAGLMILVYRTYDVRDLI
jgi:small conductance mechanosensitive channel